MWVQRIKSQVRISLDLLCSLGMGVGLKMPTLQSQDWFPSCPTPPHHGWVAPESTRAALASLQV